MLKHFFILVLFALQGCKPAPDRKQWQDFSLPVGFSVTTFAEGVGKARHMVVRDNGDLFIRLQKAHNGFCNVALRDTNHDGTADITEYFGQEPCGTGIAIKEPYLYIASREKVERYRFTQNQLTPLYADILVEDLGSHPTHSSRSLAISNTHLYVNLGGPSNACQRIDRQRWIPGQNPCPELKDFGGIYRFDLNVSNQKKTPLHRYATGVRNAVALDWNREANKLYALQHGRDQLADLYPKLYDRKASAEKPAEEFFEINAGDDFGWPYCYYDPELQKKVLSPEYGGNGQKQGLCAKKKPPMIGFPAHYAPNDLIFYQGTQFPKKYQNGAFIAFHGSWNRYPEPQQGYNVVFVPFKNGFFNWSVFADGFAGKTPILKHTEARYRPVSLAETPEGYLMVADSTQGKIWQIRYAL